MAIYSVYVNVRARYIANAATEKEARKIALDEARNGMMPEELEYVGDGIALTTLDEED